MSFKTRQQMLDNVLNELGLVTGSSVQVYSEPMIQQNIQTCFDHLFTKRFWDHLTQTTFHVLDGAAGVVTDDVVKVESVSDIKWVRVSPYEITDDIPYVADGIFNSDYMAYATIPFGTPYYDNKRIVFNPITSVDMIAIRARRKPDDFTDTDVIPFDHVALTHFVTSSVLAVDGMNPASQERQDILFNDRYETLVSNESDHKIISTKNRFASEFTVAP